MPEHISATEARVHFGAVMQRVKRDRQVLIVDKNGEPQAAIVPADAVEDIERQMRSEQVDALFDRMRELRRGIHERLEREGKTMPPAWKVIREMREERSDHLYRCVFGDSAGDRAPAADES